MCWKSDDKSERVSNVKSKKTFLEEYHLQEIYACAEGKGLTWKRLSDIYEDYRKRYYDRYSQNAQKIVERLYKNAPDEVKIIYARAKDPEHLVEKIVRKIGKEDKASYADINVKNYRSIITDLIGIRILILKKEDWDKVDQHIRKKFREIKGDPIAYVCYGDRDIYDETRIRIDYTNKGYRSQHYIIYYQNIPCEIQVRTLAEEVYGEFDHKIRYPYRDDNKFLKRYNKIISKVISELDDLISTCSDELDKTFVNDKYTDWQKKIKDEGSVSAVSSKASKPESQEMPATAQDLIVKKLIDR